MYDYIKERFINNVVIRIAWFIQKFKKKEEGSTIIGQR